MASIKHYIRVSAPRIFHVLHVVGKLRPSYWRSQIDYRRRVESAKVIDEKVRELIGSDSVQAGPFTGMKLARDSVWSTDWSARALGTYELELHPHFQAIIASNPPVVVDVGCADGYYAVGLAITVPRAHVIAYDIDDAARAATRELARINGVEDRVEVRGRCLPSDLENLPQGSLVLVDCEGLETEMVTTSVARSNDRSSFVIECHDFLDHSISDKLVSRFTGRQLCRVAVQPRQPEDAPGIPPTLASEAVNEYRSSVSSWLVVAAQNLSQDSTGSEPREPRFT